VRRLSEALAGCDLVHCFKNRSHMITALAAAKARGLPLVLDLDDWELGLFLEGVAAWPRWRQAVWGRPVAARIAAALHLEELARTAPSATLVNSRALQGMFGGSVAYTAADAAAFDPIRADGAAFRVRHGIPVAAPLVGFLGTPHPHKGVESLLAAMALLRRELPAARLLVVGVPPHNAYYARLAADPAVTALGYVPADDYPHAYAACDVLAVPQRPVTEGIMQTPAKLILSLASSSPPTTTRLWRQHWVWCCGTRLAAPPWDWPPAPASWNALRWITCGNRCWQPTRKLGVKG
jgi:glycosyltransferase involved in cell wall biosynthesis